MNARSIAVVLLALGVSALSLQRRPRPEVAGDEREGDVVLPPDVEPTPVPPPSPVPPPALSEVQPALDRVFGRILAVDRRGEPAFLAGDFNGDDVTDLAVAVRPRDEDAVARLNAELPGWSLQDAAAPPGGPATRPPVAPEERLLAVVHGVEPGGWRHPDARQSYVVKNAGGARMRLRPLADMPEATRMQAIRVHIGDVIVVDRDGEPGLVFWNGAAYVWAPLEPGAVP